MGFLKNLFTPNSHTREYEGIPLMSGVTEAQILAMQGLMGIEKDRFTVVIDGADDCEAFVEPDQTIDQVRQSREKYGEITVYPQK